ncbi:exodeoxyribonuclease VII large subunit [Terriglobus aquaticus]|uniref:Exodeoxyribonuclease 7 large subunit n=1 Tax=Terriglobus aquaticus TaxID=940139 RepID=A0ABW9KHJ3_9BACT|nr:exodeoxyribonuclease VII large subunit [Terriglobus aquaticus]
MEREPVAPSLAQLHVQRNRARQAKWSAEPTADALGQFGLLFEAPAPPVVEPIVEVAAAETRSVAPVPGPVTASVEVAPEVVRVAERAGVLPERTRDDAPWTVGELVGTLRGRLENHGTVWVVGEICNFRPAQSGHVYFTLKDGAAQVGAVLFRRQAAMLRWQPGDGAAVLLRGRLSVFEGRGQLQLIAEMLEPRGAGALQVQFEQLKAKLRDEGLFDAERKRALPAFPRRVGVVTSVQGAVIRDIVTVCRRRHGCMNLLVYPAAVQGTGAAVEIAAGIRYFNRVAEGGQPSQVVDLIVLARGGGSAEDLAAFNEEALARTIAASHLPVVSAVGHETDFTIADFVADLRAATPSAAAEMITESQHRVEERLQALESRLYRAVRFQQMSARQRFTRLATAGVLQRTQDGIERRQQRVDMLSERLERASIDVRRQAADRLRRLDARLQRQDVRAQLQHARTVLRSRVDRLEKLGAGLTVRSKHRLESASARLGALSPLAVLDRGYALAFTEGGAIVRSAEQLTAGERIVTRFASGSAVARVEEIRSREERGKDGA